VSQFLRLSPWHVQKEKAMQTSLDDLALLLGEVALFRDLPSTAIADIARSTEVVSLPKCRIVYAAGDHPRALYHVMSGHLKVSVSSPDGDEKVIEILSPRPWRR